MITQKMALLHAQSGQFRKLVNRTSGFIRWALERVNNPYVSCSFGKDSSVMLHLILPFRPGIKVIWLTFPETKYLNNYYEVAEIWKKRFGINLEEIFIDIPAHDPFDDTTAFPRAPYDAYFSGITKEESRMRTMTLKSHGMFFKKKDGMIRIAPLADWRIIDVAAYIFKNDLPLLNSYKTEGFESRTITGFADDINAFRLNQLSELKRRDVSAFNKMILEWPELKNYV